MHVSKTKSTEKKLPEKLYYKLAEAATWLTSEGLACAPSDILDLGSRGYLELVARLDGVFGQCDFFDDSSYEPVGYTPIFELHGFVALRRFEVERIEYTGQCSISASESLYIIGEFPPGNRLSEEQSLMISQSNADNDGILQAHPVSIAIEDLYIRTEELKRFLNDKDDHIPSATLSSAGPPKIDPRIGRTDLNVIAALLELLTDKKWQQFEIPTAFKSEADLIEFIEDKFGDIYGLRKTSLQKKFADAKKSLLS